MAPTFAILSPLTVEFEAVCKKLIDLQEPSEQILPTRLGRIGRHAVVCVLSGKGEEKTASALQYVLDNWRPRWVLLVGVAGGFPELKVRRGDVVISKFVYAYDFGKLEQGHYIRRPEYDFQPDRSLLAHAEYIAEREDQGWVEQIGLSRPDDQPPTATRAHVGYIASGNKVIDDPDHAFFQVVHSTLPEIHAVDMEGSGAGASISLEQARRAIGFLMIRGISDEPAVVSAPDTTSGSNQRQLWKGYAAAAAAAFVQAFLSAFPSHEVPTHGSLEKDTQEYKRELFDEISIISVLDILKPRQHKNIFVNPALSADYIAPDYSESIASEDTVNIETILDLSPHGLVILGEAGSGKSTLLKEIALNYTGEKIPVIIESRHITSVYKEYNTFTTAHCIKAALLEYGAQNLADNIDQVLETSSVVLMLDGLDEVPEHIDEVLSQLLAFRNSYVSCRVIVASRIQGYKKGILKNFRHATISPFDRYKIGEFILRWFDEATGQTFKAYLFDDVALFNLAKNPLFLTMMAIVFEYKQKYELSYEHKQTYNFPGTITELYEKFTAVMLSEWDEVRGIKRNKIPARIKNNFLQIVAYNSPIEEYVPQEKLYSSFSSVNGEGVTVDNLIDEIVFSSGLLVRRHNVFRFWHSSIANYYCAKYIATQSLEDDLISHLMDRTWEHIHVFYFGLAIDPTCILKELLEKQKTGIDRFRYSLALLGKCFFEGLYKDPRASVSKTFSDYRDIVFDLLKSNAFNSDYSYIRNVCVKNLSRFREPEIFTYFHKKLSEYEEAKEYQRLEETTSITGNFPYKVTSQMIVPLIEESTLPANVRSNAIYALASYPVSENISYIESLSKREDYPGLLKSAAIIVLGRLGNESAYEMLNRLFSDENLVITERVRAAGSLARAGKENSIEFLKNIVVLPKWIRHKIVVPSEATFAYHEKRSKRSDAILNARKSALTSLSYISKPEISEFFRDILSLGILPERLSESFQARKDWMDRQEMMADGERSFEQLERNLRKEAIRLLPRVESSLRATEDAVIFLRELLEKEKWSLAKEEILFSLGKLGDDSVMNELLSISNNDQIGLRRRKAALVGLANIERTSVYEFLEEIAFGSKGDPLADTAFSCLAFKEKLLGNEFIWGISA